MRKIMFTVLALLAAFPIATLALQVGDPAPSLQVSKWLVGQGQDPSKPDNKHIYVVEIWATWCPPCRMSIPHLNKLHKKLKDKGVVLMGITAEDEATVTGFLKDTPMAYNVGIDKDKATSEAYNTAKGGVPRAFVIDKTGKVVWAGHPMGGLDRVLDKIVAGTYSLKVAQQLEEVEKELRAAAQIADVEAVGKAIDKLISLEPDNPKYYVFKTSVLQQQGNPDPAEMRAVYSAWAKGCEKDPDALGMLVKTMLSQDYAVRDPELIMASAKKALALSGPSDVETAAMMAEVYAEFGMLDKAIGVLKKAAAAAKDPGVKAALQAQLDYYTKLKRLQGSAK